MTDPTQKQGTGQGAKASTASATAQTAQTAQTRRAPPNRCDSGLGAGSLDGTDPSRGPPEPERLTASKARRDPVAIN